MKYRIIIGGVALCSIGWAQQLKLICASPGGNVSLPYSATIETVVLDGSLESARLSPSNSAIEWVAISTEAKIGVLIERLDDSPESAAESRISVVDLNRGAVSKTCSFPLTPGVADVEQWLFRDNSGRVSYVSRLASFQASDEYLRRFDLSESVPCGESFAKIAATEAVKMVAAGAPGVGAYASDGTYLTMRPDGELTKIASGQQIPLGYTVPLSIRGNNEWFGVNLVVSNESMLAIVLLQGGDKHQFAIYRKQDGKWLYPVFPPGVGRYRAFGRFVVGIDSELGSDGRRTSAGSNAWRSAQGRPGYRIEEFFARSKKIFPGRLYVYDVVREKVIILTTEQADSEVLLIEQGDIYYRAADVLYKVAVTDGVLGSSVVLAKGDVLRDAHWAFLTGEGSK